MNTSNDHFTSHANQETQEDAPPVLEGDRYWTNGVCSPVCAYRTKHPVPDFLAVDPYSFVFSARVKGRWLTQSLLSLFVKEFAYVPPASSDKETAVSTDPRVTAPAYIEELEKGWLWLEGREAECRAAGRAYKQQLIDLWRERHKEGSPSVPEAHPDPEEAWSQVKQWLAEGTMESVEALVSSEGSNTTTPFFTPVLSLRQKDTIQHRVRRREGRIFAHEPIRVIQYKPAGGGLLYMLVHKPAGMPVHPSGSYRKNSVKSILEDIFGGDDRFFYEAERHDDYISIVHRQHRFEVIRVCLKTAEEDSDRGDGLTEREWETLHKLLVKEPEVEGAPSHRKRPRGNDKSDSTRLNLFVTHRLDIVTEGVLVFGLTSDSARDITTLFANKKEDENDDREKREGSSSKEYLALVPGLYDPVALARTAHHTSLQADGGLLVCRPIGCLSYHISAYWCPSVAEADRASLTAAAAPPVDIKTVSLDEKHERMRELTKGKPLVMESEFLNSLRTAESVFYVEQYDSERNVSLLRCRLYTGRTHQLRVHLASLGFPILLDDMYATLSLSASNLSPGVPTSELLDLWRQENPDCSDTHKGCVCPTRIYLCAFRYGLHTASQGTVCFQSVVPSWAGHWCPDLP